jgi:glycosyltransferase involved in cell wall biosynthesis
MQGISVIICCYNSALLLPETIKHLALQKVTDNIPWEVIVVNNNSTDNTEEVAKVEWKRYNLKIPLRVIHESTPGLSNARKAGIFAAVYEYSIFCDDDNWLDPNYIQIAYKIMGDNTEIGMLGGQSTAVCQIEAPNWFEEKKDIYAVGKQGDKTGDITLRGYLWGAGLVLRTNVLVAIYNLNLKSLLSDRKGNDLTSGGDSELSSWFIMAGYKLWYSDLLKFQHYILTQRLNEEYYTKLLKAFEQPGIILSYYKDVIGYKRNINIKFIVELSKDIFRYFKFNLLSKNNTIFAYKNRLRLQLKLGLSFKIDDILYTIINYEKKLKTKLKKQLNKF